MQQDELLARFRDDMERLLHATELVRTEAAIVDDWTAREILAHVAAWDRELARGLDQLLAGERPSFADYDEAAFNDRAVRASAGRSLDDVIEEASAAHQALIGAIATLSDEDWIRTSRFRWSNGQPMTVASLFQYAYRGETHYSGHAAEIEHHSKRRADS